MKIAKALKRIAKLKGEIAELVPRISQANSAMEDNEFQEQIMDILKQQHDKVGELIQLKAAVMKANVDCGMYVKILEMAELKSQIQIFKTMTIKIGKEVNYGEGFVNWRSQIDVPTRNKTVEALETRIEELRDVLDNFNASTDIKVEFAAERR